MWLTSSVTSTAAFTRCSVYTLQHDCWRSIAHKTLRVEKGWTADRMIVKMFGRSSQAGASSSNHGHWPPETSPEQLLGYDETRISKRCGLDDICYSSIFRVDILSIVPINSVKFTCCSPYFCHDFALKMSPVLMFWIVQLPAVKKSTYMQYWNSVRFRVLH